MSERKVLNKYFPPDFDPSKIPRRKMPKDSQMTVRLMAPFTMSCNTCGEFIYKGKKFNAKKETAKGEEYYGIKIFRFYIKCTRCSAEITFKTDPKNADYICEHGAKRNFEPTTAEASHVPNAADDDSDAADGNASDDDPMKALEASQAAALQQMQDEDLLADLRSRNARLERGDVDLDQVLRDRDAERVAGEEAKRRKEAEEDEEVVKRYFYKVKAGVGVGARARAGGPGLGTVSEEGEAPGLGLGDGYASDDEVEATAAGATTTTTPATVTVKRSALGSGAAAAEPTVQELLAAKGIDFASRTTAAVPVKPKPTVTGIKRKEGGVLGLGVKLKKKKQ
ncbi:hypothetical protein NliqN6_0524 [Naganishia liquefaciens]|uniref:Splicing factor YJU2 n=1 Tax=Naganishia liquefaciens TaxID=104408 RepID=A0A8H3TN17_9TREE|nr:hypothetical protein NliqN6_0524 [Naganishia liquefaciens]